MKHLADGAHVHLIAVCGTAMGSLASMLAERGFRVTGSDRHIYPPMSDYLAEAGIQVLEGFDESRLQPPPDLVVVGNAVSRGNPEVEATLNHRLPYAHLPEVIRDLFLSEKRPIIVTGTHGKTTTTALTAHLLSVAGRDPSFLVAGLPHNFPRPFNLGQGEEFVIEGDEYDSAFFAKYAKFLFYRPETVVINNIEYDHADIYRNLSEIEDAFRRLINMVPSEGLIVANAEDPVVTGLLSGSFAPVQSFGLCEGADWRATDIESGPEGQRFSVVHNGIEVGRPHLRLHGIYNIRNTLAAIACCGSAGVTFDELEKGIESFSGIRRRQEIIGTIDGIILIDDFAHHPTSVEQTLQGLRKAYPERRLWTVFEPASASNARDIFEARYVAAFAAADRVLLAPVPRPERSGDAPRLQPDRLAAQLMKAGTQAQALADAKAILQVLCSDVTRDDVIVFMSNGGFGGLQQKALAALRDLHGS